MTSVGYNRNFCVSFILVILFFFASQVSCTFNCKAKDISFSDLAEKSDLLFAGKILEQTGPLEDRGTVKIKLFGVIKGELNPSDGYNEEISVALSKDVISCFEIGDTHDEARRIFFGKTFSKNGKNTSIEVRGITALTENLFDFAKFSLQGK